MKNLWKNYKQTIILVISIIIGTIAGLIFKEKADIVKPFGDLFLNLMFVVIVPLVFLTVTTTIAKMKSPKRLGKIMASILFVFIITSLVAVLVGVGTTFMTNLVDSGDKVSIEKMFSSSDKVSDKLNFLDSTVKLISVDDFSGLLSKENVVAILVFGILFGLAIKMSGKKAEPVVNFLNAANDITFNLIKIIMYYAPIGLGCYFAALVGSFGASIAVGFAKTFVIYTVVAVLYYFIIYSIYAFISGGKEGFKRFWKNIVPPTFTALATCSSGATIPANIEASKKIGVPDDVAETVIPLGTSLHKDGTIIGSVFKIMFLVYLFGMDMSSNIVQIMVVAIIANLLISAVPIGGGTVSEMMIISMMGFPVAALPVLTMIATIIDPPATMLNAVGETSSSMLVARVVDGKKWLNKKS